MTEPEIAPEYWLTTFETPDGSTKNMTAAEHPAATLIALNAGRDHGPFVLLFAIRIAKSEHEALMIETR